MVCSGTIYDRFGHILAQVDEGAIKYSEDKALRTAVMHAVGDLEGNVATGALTAFSSRLSGLNIINGAYRFQPKQRELWLTLDADLCATAYRSFAAARERWVSIIIRRGNTLHGQHTSLTRSILLTWMLTPKVRRSLYQSLVSASYTPGSVFKLVTTAAALKPERH